MPTRRVSHVERSARGWSRLQSHRGVPYQRGSSIDALIELASRRPRPSRSHCAGNGGLIYTRAAQSSAPDPTKAKSDYNDDLARVVDVARATGIFVRNLAQYQCLGTCAANAFRSGAARTTLVVRYRPATAIFRTGRRPPQGELQMNCSRPIVLVKEKVHNFGCAGWTARRLASRRRLPETPTYSNGRLSSCQRVRIHGELETALKRVLPQGLAIANVDIGEHGDSPSSPSMTRCRCVGRHSPQLRVVRRDAQ